MWTLITAVGFVLLVVSTTDAHHRPGHGGEPPSRTLHVYDAFEQRLGQYTALGCFVRQIEGYWVEICGLEAQGSQEIGLYFLLFSDPGCSGRAYLTTWSESEYRGSLVGDNTFRGDPLNRLSRRGFIREDRSVLVFASDPIAWVPVQSWLDPDGGDCFELEPGYETPAGPALFVNIQDWVPPFTIR